MLRDTCPDFGAPNDLWRVRLATGEQPMSLDDLDLAFEAGRIDADTLVCPPGAFAFSRLGAIAGLDEPAAAAPAPAPTQATPPLAFDIPVDFGAPDLAPFAATEPNPFAPRWSRRLLAVPAALAAIGIIAFAASASASSELPAVAVATDLHAPDTAPPPAAPTIAAPVVLAPPAPAAPTLTDEQKKALAAKDKKAEARKAKKAAAAPARRAPGSKSAPFTKGGNKHDPLNGAL
jgi:hypothetical protein